MPWVLASKNKTTEMRYEQRKQQLLPELKDSLMLPEKDWQGLTIVLGTVWSIAKKTMS